MASRRSPPPRPIRCSGPKPPHSPIPMRSMTLIQNRSRAAMVERKIPSCRFVTILMGTAAWILRQRLFVAVNWFSLECTPNLPICQTAGGLGVCPKIVGSPVGQAVNGLAEVAQGAGSALSLRWSFGKPGCLGEEGRFSASSSPEPGRLRPGEKASGPARRNWDTAAHSLLTNREIWCILTRVSNTC